MPSHFATEMENPFSPNAQTSFQFDVGPAQQDSDDLLPIIAIEEGEGTPIRGSLGSSGSYTFTKWDFSHCRHLPVYWLVGGTLLIVLLIGLSVIEFAYLHSGRGANNVANRNVGQSSLNITEEMVEGLEKLSDMFTKEQFSRDTNTSANVSAHDLGEDLILAVGMGDEATVRKLIALGADLNVRTPLSETPLHFVAVGDDKEVGVKMAKFLMEKGVDPFVIDKVGHTFLHNFLEDKGWPMFNLTQFQDITQYLISRNLSRLFNIPGNFSKEVNARFNYTYNLTTPFQLAVKNLEIPKPTLRLLKDNGVDFNAVNSRGDSTLFYTLVGNRSLEMMSNLIDLGADRWHLNYFKENMLHLAALYGGVDELKYFFNVGLDINDVDELGDMPLHKVVNETIRDVLGKARFLLENGADVGIRNKMGKTPLEVVQGRDGLADKVELIELLSHTN